LLQVFVADRVRQVADVKFVAHQGTPLKHISKRLTKAMGPVSTTNL